jgi:hypothetical protein
VRILCEKLLVFALSGGLQKCTQDLHTFNALLTSCRRHCMVEKAYTASFWCRVEAMSYLSCPPGAPHLDVANASNVTQLHLSCTPKPFYVGLSSIYRVFTFRVPWSMHC